MANLLKLTAFLCFLWTSVLVSAEIEVNMCSGQLERKLSAYITLTNSSATNSYCQCTIVENTRRGSFKLTLTAQQENATEFDDVCVTALANPELTELAEQCFQNGTAQQLTIVDSHPGNMMLTFGGLPPISKPGGSSFLLKVYAAPGTVDITCYNTPPTTTAAEETTTLSTTAAQETTTLSTTAAQETTTLSTTAAQETTTLSTTAAQETTTLSTTAAEETTTLSATEDPATVAKTEDTVTAATSTNNSNTGTTVQTGAQTSTSDSSKALVTKIVLGTLGAVVACLLIAAVIITTVHSVKARSRVRPLNRGDIEE